MEEYSEVVISKEDVNSLNKHLNVTDFFGVEYDKIESLFEHGFLYDSRTGDIIVTNPHYEWDDIGVDARFGVTNITKDKIEEVFEKDSTNILMENEITLPTWNDICEEYKISLINTTNGGLNLSKVHLDMDVSGLINYLKNKV